MSIANKIASIKNHVEDIYNTLDKTGNLYILPEEYTQVDYIQSSGTQYIDTGYTPIQNDEIEIKNVSILSNGALFSAGAGTYQLIYLKLDALTYYKYFATGAAAEYVGLSVENKTIKVDKNGVLYVDNVAIMTSTYSGVVNSTLQLFNRYPDSSYIHAKMGEIKITNGTTLKRHFIPCYRNSDNVIGLYDLVNDMFYINKGTGVFTYGAIDKQLKIPNKNIENINYTLKEQLKYYLINGLDIVWNNWEKVLGNGTTFTLNNTVKAPMKIELKGNTSQVNSLVPNGYTQVDYIESSGTQYIDTNYTPVQNDSIEIKNFKLNSITNIPAVFSAGTTDPQFIFLLGSDSSIYYKYFASGNVSAILVDNLTQQEQTIKIDSTGIYFNGVKKGTSTYEGAVNSPLRLFYRASQTGEKYNGRIGRITITNGNITKLDLLPCYRNNDNVVGMYDLVSNTFYTNSGTGTFTYGSVVPNPDYPQDIEVVSGDNSIKVEGKNLFDKDNATILMAYINTTTQKITATDQHDYATTWIKVKPNTTYTISKRAGKSFRVATFTNQPTIDGETYNQTTANHTGTSITITTGANDNYIAFLFWSINNGDTGTYQEMLSTIQVVIGNTAPTTYTPYVSQTYPISLGNIELCKIGTYQDKIYKDNDKWYLHKEIGKVVLDGSEMWNLRTDISYSDIAAFRDNDYVAGSVITNSTSVCNYFTPLTSQQNAVGLRLIDVNNYGYQVQVPKTIASTIAEFKIWITNHNLIIYHPLATPTNTEITDSSLLNQLNNLYNANSYDETTNVSQVNDDLESILNVTALEDMAATASLTSLNMSRVLPVSSDEPLTESNEEEAEINTEPIEENEENIEEEINER